MKTEPLPVLVLSNHGVIIGGGELSLLDLLGSIDRSHWAPIVVMPAEGEVAERCRALQLPTHVIRMPSLRRPSPAVVTSVIRMTRLVRLTGAKLLHANGSRAMFYAGLAGRFARCPVIWHVRVADRDPFWDRVLSRFARLIITNSQAVATRFRTLKTPPVQCVHNGVDLSRFSPRRPPEGLRRSLGLPQEAAVVMSVGRFVAYKGYHDLLEAAALVQRTRREIHWILVGEGELKDSLRERAKHLALNGHVHFPGWREDIPDLLALCDLFVLPSLGEHFGRVLIEAMAMAKPIIATAAGGVPEIVTDGVTGHLVPQADPPAMARAIQDLLENAEKASRFGAAGRRRAQAEFSLTQHAERMAAIYAKTLGDQHGKV